MKTIFLQFVAIVTLCFFYVKGFSQDVLRYGVTPNQPVVELPVAYWDILHNTANGWVWQLKTASTNRWNNYEKATNKKDADGLFTEVTTLTWLPGTQTWQEDTKNLYAYQKNMANQVVEVTWEKETPFYFGAVRFANTYTLGKLTEQVISFKNGGVFVPVTDSYTIYDGAGNRILDSGISVQTGNPNYKSVYEYSGNRCVKNTYWGLNPAKVMEVANYSTYSYTASGQLETTSAFTRVNNGALEETTRDEYTYTSLGMIDELVEWKKDATATLLEPDNMYKHYYNTLGKPLAMVKKQYKTGSWVNVDSIVLNYLSNNVGYDTGYIYVANTSGIWESQPSQRLLFDISPATTIQQPVLATHSLKAYPNPVKESLHVEFEGTATGNADVLLTDLTGKEVKSQQVEVIAGETTNTELSVDDLAPGIYMLNTEEQSLKIIVE